MKQIQQLMSSIRRIFGISNSVRSTAKGVKREASFIAGGLKTNDKEPKIN